MRSSGCRVTINGQQVELTAMQGADVDMDLDKPDMATITLANSSNFNYAKDTNLGDSVEVKISSDKNTSGNDQPSIFKGEVVGIEPQFDVSGASQVKIRAFNKLHHLTRGRKSKTYMKVSDSDIVNKIAGLYGLTASVKGDVNTKYDHVYQHNQTDLEFLLHRAARINYEIFVNDTTLNFRKRDTSVDSGIVLELGKKHHQHSLQKFSPRLSSAAIVQQVYVRAFDPTKMAVVVGNASSVEGSLGSDTGVSKSATFGSSVYHYDVDVPVKSVEEANAIAKAKLAELSLNYITGDAVSIGNPHLKAGIVVKINCDSVRFGGKYYLIGVSHKFGHDGGFTTHMRVRRSHEGGGDTPDGPAAVPQDQG